MSVRWVYAVLIAYVVGFALFPPRVFLVVDEERYVTQAMAFARGTRTLPGATVFTGTGAEVISDFPPGTSLMQTPFVLIGGWRAAALASVLALVLTTLVTMRLLREHQRQPAFALVVPAFIGTLFFGRIGMSDVPTAMLVAVAIWLLFRTNNEDWRGSLLAGFVSGLVLLFREPPVLLLAPIALGAILRKRCVPWALVAGGAAGIAARLLVYEALLGSAAHVRDSLYGFSAHSVTFGLPLYGGILLILLPAGLLLPAAYRGPRRAELVCAMAAYIGLFVFYDYNAVHDNGPAKGVILASRYMVPALPLFAFMAAYVVPSISKRVFHDNGSHERAIARVAACFVAAAAFLIHPAARRQEVVPLAIVRDIYAHTQAQVPVITNTSATLKYMSPAYGMRRLIPTHALHSDSVSSLARAAGGALDVVLLDRDDSEMFRKEAIENGRLVEELRRRCAVQRVEEVAPASWARLRVFRLTDCG